MPGFNGKGPQGEGPSTGRGMGKCKVQNSDNAENNFGRGNGGGRRGGCGGGRGRRCGSGNGQGGRRGNI